MRRKLLYSLVGFTVLAVGLLALNLSLGYKPALGLDLRGGISVTLRPVAGQDFTTESLDLATERIRERVDSFGVGEPEIIRQDDAIVVNLPGVNDQQQALDLVNVTGKVYLRPVLQCVPAPVVDESATSTTVADTSTTTATTVAGDTTTTVAPTSTTEPDTVSSGGGGESRHVASSPTTEPPTTDPATTQPATTQPATSTTIVDAGTTTTTVVPTETTSAVPFSDPTQEQILDTRGTTDREVCQVGPSGGTGEVFEKDSAEARILDGNWGVAVDLKGGGSGEGIWNSLATQCYNRSETCPSQRLAIELDGEIQSAPTVQTPTFDNGTVTITGQFTKGEASKLAQVLNSGALPITLQNEAIENVSATLGKDSLRAALIAGGVGVGLVVLFMILYYRRLAIVVIGGLAISGALVYSVASLISRFYNGVLSLSGVAGLIVSIGVTIDSYVVFFERLKDEVRGGRSLRNSAQRGFKAAFRTILIADAVSLIGATVLWYLSVGAVRGFAFYLGLSTVMDIFVAYFFTRPAVLLLARSRFMGGDKILGLESHEKDSTAVAGATS